MERGAHEGAFPAGRGSGWELGITVVPMRLVLDGREYRDGIDITPPELYRRMRQEHIIPHTSSPSPGEYEEVFWQVLRRGADSVACLTLASRLSMGYNAARIAAENMQAACPQRTVVEVMDTRMATRAEGFVVVEAARAAAAGCSLEQVLAAARAARARVGLIAMVGTLEYLARGGRVPSAVSLVGNALQVKPLLTIKDDGSAVCVARRRSVASSLQYMIEFVAGCTHGAPPALVAAMHADAPEEAAELKEMAARAWPQAAVWVTDFTPVMGGHTGPGLAGLAYYCG